jgi:phosphatidylserine/phosphatidylglycerophosphate/cardiolipin synthase-like enzyme
MRSILLAFTVALVACTSPTSAPPAASIEIHFSPSSACRDAIVQLIDSARSTIRVQAYSFTSRPITRALVEAHRRGVTVEMVLDRSDRRSNRVKELQAAGVRVWFDASHPIAHDKVVIVDDRAVSTGSFNLTAQAERNAENCLVIRQEPVARQYTAHWTEHRAHAEP